MGKKKGNGASSVFPERCVAVQGRKEVAMPVNTASGSRKNPGICSCAQFYRIERQVLVFLLILASTFIPPITAMCRKFAVINLFQQYDITIKVGSYYSELTKMQHQLMNLSIAIQS